MPDARVREDKSPRPSDPQLRDVGDTLRSSWQTPTDTMITDDIPTLLTLLSRIPKAPRQR